MTREYESFNQAYCELIVETVQKGLHFTPRNFSCLELRPGQFTLKDCRQGLYTGYSRRLNYRFLAVETLAYLAGWGNHPKHAELMCAVNSQMARFVNPLTGCFDGAYGPRLAHSLPGICKLLKDDPSTRQAYASIWMPGCPWPSLDVPCTLGLHFYQDVSDGGEPVLSMSAYMRSNDLNWGTPYDVAAFCSIQIAMAACVNLTPGRYHHISGSLHMYDETPPKVNIPSAECWLKDGNGDICLPNPAIISPAQNLWIGMLMDQAACVCDDLHHHLVVCQEPGRDFVARLEVIKNPLREYWKEWGDLIRFNWKEQQ